LRDEEGKNKEVRWGLFLEKSVRKVKKGERGRRLIMEGWGRKT